MKPIRVGIRRRPRGHVEPEGFCAPPKRIRIRNDEDSDWPRVYTADHPAEHPDSPWPWAASTSRKQPRRKHRQHRQQVPAPEHIPGLRLTVSDPERGIDKIHVVPGGAATSTSSDQLKSPP